MNDEILDATKPPSSTARRWQTMTTRNYKHDHGHWTTIMVVCVAIIAAMLFVFKNSVGGKQ